MTVLSIDIETYSDVSLRNCGVYKYTESPNFKILLFGYAFDDDSVEMVDLANGEKLPKEVMKALVNKDVIKSAFNAQFERVCINRHFNLDTANWWCTMIQALSLGFPGSLESVGKAIRLEPDKQKLMTGKKLIRLFSIPKKITKSDQISMVKKKRVYTKEDKPKEWQQFIDYCKQDVEVERDIRKKLDRFKFPDFERRLYTLDQKINDAGVLIDIEMAQNAIDIDSTQTEKFTNIYREVTGLENPNSVAEIKKYIKKRTGSTIKSITKKNIDILKEDFRGFKDITTALDIRSKLSKTSIAKYQKMVEVPGEDNRARGLLQFYGASRTGRWAGRLIQLQNLPQNHIDDLDTARKAVKTGDLELLEMIYDDPSEILSQCIRTAIIPAEGKKFVVSDFSAIEARVLSWLAGEKWRLDVFNSHGKIYEASASAMFKVPIEEITKGSPLRQKGKISELALGYGGSVGALKQMGALDRGLKLEELKPLVNSWRNSNPRIVRFWYETENKVMDAIRNRAAIRINDKLRVEYKSSILFIRLPSGRKLAYVKPKLADHKKFPGKKEILFHEINPRTYQWDENSTYGGKLVENITQAIARDLLAEAMVRLDERGYKIVMHVHDEVVIEVDENKDCLEEINNIMAEPTKWTKGLPLKADGYECSYYKKD